MDMVAMFLAKHFLFCIIYALSLVWVLWWTMSSEARKHNTSVEYLAKIEKHIHSRFFRTDDYYGSVLIYQTAPFILVAILSFAVIELRKLEGAQNKSNITKKNLARPRIATYPLVVGSPLGVLTAADTLFIVALLFLTTYSFARTAYLRCKELEHRFQLEPELFNASLQVTKLAYASYCMGRSAMIPFSLLWIPVSRGSPFLRLIKMPFEHAVKYHIWLAMLTLSMLTLHSLGYITYYFASHTSTKIIGWEAEGEECSVVAGLIALVVGLTMWATSISFFRRRWYELFFGVHHLYIIFFLFWLYHVIWTVHFFIIPCLLFMVDRFLRMLQSRQSVDVLSVRLLESGSLHLTIAARQDINSEGGGSLLYHALSSWYLRMPSLSRLMKLQWHFFSVTSTPVDGKEELSIVIKPFGKWTANLRDQLFESSRVQYNLNTKNTSCPFSFKAAAEGPYGDESDFFLKYKVLILIGGGIGVTPLLALLGDVLHRKRLGQKDLPDSILLYHCVRKLEQLCVLNLIDPNSIVPEYEKHGLSVRVFAYVTSNSLEDYTYKKSSSAQGTPALSNTKVLQSPKVLSNGRAPQGVCSIGSTGKSIWVGSTLIASMVGFYVLWGLSNVFIIKKPQSNLPNYNRAHLVVASMVLGTSMFGGVVVMTWWSHLKKQQKMPPSPSPPPSTDAFSTDLEKANSFSNTSITSSAATLPSTTSTCSTNMLQQVRLAADTSPQAQLLKPPHSTLEKVEDSETDGGANSLASHGSPWNGILRLRCRPHWNEIFISLNKEYRGQNIGVLVSGPPSMQQDIATECRRHTTLFDKKASANVFHYHPISFDL